MRFAVLYGSSTTNDFVVAALLRQHEPVLLVSEDQPALRVVSRAMRRRGDSFAARLDKLAFFALYAAFLRRRVDRDLHERLGAHEPPRPHLRVGDVNDALEPVRAASPAFVLALGTSILRRPWHSLGVPILNVHIGIAPRYRGRFCWFWPILEGRPGEVGVTVHLVTPRVDAGPVVLQRRADPRALGERSFAELLGAVTLLSRDLCAELLAEPERLLAEAKPPADATAVASRAYLEPGLTDYFRFVRARRLR
jgi:hypothetical protein